MAFMMRTGRMLLQLVTFLLLLAVLSKAITFVTAERYAGVGEPSPPWKLTTPRKSAPLRASSSTVLPPKQ